MPSVNPKKIAELEALLFTYGEPIQLKKVAELLDVPPDECGALVGAYEESLYGGDSGLMLQRDRDRIQLSTKPDYSAVLQKIIREEFKEELTPAALEALSLISYLGPIPRATVDYIRGVNSSFTIRNLLMRGLVERNQDPERKHAYEYKITMDFLKHIGIARVSDLPEYEKFNALLSKYDVFSD